MLWSKHINEDKQYYKAAPEGEIGADVYSASGMASYSCYWSNEEDILSKQINGIGDPAYAIAQIKEQRVVKKILLDLPEFLEFIRDRKGLPLKQHIENGFSDIIKFMIQ